MGSHLNQTLLYKILLTITIFLTFCIYKAKAQVLPKSEQNIVQDSTEKKKVLVDRSDIAEGIQENGKETRYLKGGVELRQGNVYMYCDTAIIRENNVIAVGDVLIQQGDSLNIFSDSLYYNGNERIADLYGDVRLDNMGKKLFTNQLHYDLNTKIASFNERSLITNDTTFLESNTGKYYVKEKLAEFRNDVIVIDTAFTLKTDSLDFSTETGILDFIAPTVIHTDDAKIYCEDGFYDTQESYAEFVENAQYLSGDKTATAEIISYDGKKNEIVLKLNAKYRAGDDYAEADKITYLEQTEVLLLEGNAYLFNNNKEMRGERIRYDAKNDILETQGETILVEGSQILNAESIDYSGDIGYAKGNVIWRDTSEQIAIESAFLTYNNKTEEIKASGERPLLTAVIDEDTLFMRSDTLHSFVKSETDSARVIKGFYNVRIYKSNLQAVCDSLIYDTADSLFSLYQNPIIWSDTSQFFSDTVFIEMKNNNIDQIKMRSNAFIVNSPDEVYFNQIKGKNMTAFFESDTIDRMEVNGNAECIYYLRDEEEYYSGVNKSISSSMLITFAQQEIKEISLYVEPTSTLYPMTKVDHEALKLTGFSWDKRRRPISKDDLYRIVPSEANRSIRQVGISLDSTLIQKENPVRDSLKTNDKENLNNLDKKSNPTPRIPNKEEPTSKGIIKRKN